VTLSKDQQIALSHILSWFSEPKKQFITLGGYAGTGKTTLIAIVRKKLNYINKKLRVNFISYTGKAARVLNKKLHGQNIIHKQDYVGTIHSLIYSPIVNEGKEIIGWKKKDKIETDLIVVDEASMVDELIWNHLISYNIPLLVVGDHGQLPPITGNFNLIDHPELVLKTIHRQAKKNPIISLSIEARTNGHIPQGIYSQSVIKFNPLDTETQERCEELLSHYSPNTLVLCGYNHTRQKLNTYIRNSLGFETPFPRNGDRVICLRNNHEKQIYNGMLGTIQSITKKDEDWYSAEISMDNEERVYKGLISVKQFNSPSALNFTNQRKNTIQGDLFDFGYALTVHKAQGDQAKRVVLFEERFKHMDNSMWKRWLYTAVTRAEEELYIFPSLLSSYSI